jgi:hypothetical protein
MFINNFVADLPEVKSQKSEASSHKPQASSLKPQASSLKPQASSLKPQASSLKPSFNYYIFLLIISMNLKAGLFCNINLLLL